MKASKEIAGIIAGWFKAAEKGDGAYALTNVSHSPSTLLVGTDPKEWYRGRAAGQFLSNEAMSMGGKIKVKVGKVEAYEEGTVAWGVANPSITLPNGKLFQPRWSAVLHKEAGRWKIVQIHASAGIPNEQIMA
jgi:ketosteroid isomerase-like protein